MLTQGEGARGRAKRGGGAQSSVSRCKSRKEKSESEGEAEESGGGKKKQGDEHCLLSSSLFFLLFSQPLRPSLSFTRHSKATMTQISKKRKVRLSRPIHTYDGQRLGRTAKQQQQQQQPKGGSDVSAGDRPLFDQRRPLLPWLMARPPAQASHQISAISFRAMRRHYSVASGRSPRSAMEGVGGKREGPKDGGRRRRPRPKPPPRLVFSISAPPRSLCSTRPPICVPERLPLRSLDPDACFFDGRKDPPSRARRG